MSKPPSPTHPLIHLETCLPCGQKTETHGALSATATITTTILSHHATPQLPTLPNEPHGTAATTPTAVFTFHHPVLTHPQTPCQSTSLKWSATRRGSPPQNPSYIPHPQFTTTRHMPLFDLFWTSTFLKRQFQPTDTPQDPLHGLFTLHLPLSATVAPFDGLDRSKAPSGVLPDLMKGSHAYLGDIFDGGCDQDGRI